MGTVSAADWPLAGSSGYIGLYGAGVNGLTFDDFGGGSPDSTVLGTAFTRLVSWVKGLFGGNAHDASEMPVKDIPVENRVTIPSGQTWRYYYYADSARVAEREMTTASTTGTLYYFLSDHLGSTTVTLTITGAVYAESAYMPWGESREITSTGNATPTDYQYTGQRKTSTGLYYYNARWYDPYLNRWLSPDPIIPDTYNPLDWDRYSYVRNNPLIYIDSDGHFPILVVIALFGAALYFSQIPSDQYQTDPSNWGDPGVQVLGGALMIAPILIPAACLDDGNCTNEAQAVDQMTDDVVNAAQAAENGANAVPTVEQAIQNGANALKNGTGVGYNSFNAFKSAQGSAGPGMAWHHIVEQNSTNTAKFGSNLINNTSNLIKLPSGQAGLIHQRISGYYSSIQPLVTGSDTLTVRQWLQTKSFEFQWNFGVELINRFGGAQNLIDKFGAKAK